MADSKQDIYHFTPYWRRQTGSNLGVTTVTSASDSFSVDNKYLLCIWSILGADKHREYS